MCLALPAKILEKSGDDAWATLGDVRLRVNLIMTPEAELEGVHADTVVAEALQDSA